jgi:hypothetical protein
MAELLLKLPKPCVSDYPTDAKCIKSCKIIIPRLFPAEAGLVVAGNVSVTPAMIIPAELTLELSCQLIETETS